jgi:hypothetical protein
MNNTTENAKLGYFPLGKALNRLLDEVRHYLETHAFFCMSAEMATGIIHKTKANEEKTDKLFEK